MSVSYDLFTEAFLSKITEFELARLAEIDNVAAVDAVDGFLKRSISSFRKNCKYDLSSTGDQTTRTFDVEILDEDVDEIVEIISEGMVVQWLKQYLYKQEILENALNTRDFSTYSPGELLKRVGDAYEKAQRDYKQMIREYSYNHGNLGKLHL